MTGRRTVLGLAGVLAVGLAIAPPSGATVILGYSTSSPGLVRTGSGLTGPSLRLTPGGVNGPRAATAHAARLSLARDVGQLVIGTYPGVVPPRSFLQAVRAGHLGGVILMGTNTSGGVRSVHAATVKLQRAARAGGNPGLLIMTDQEGGEVKRLSGPPKFSAAEMHQPRRAHTQGVATGRLLRRAGVNMDLAPVADVIRTNGFIAREHRSFGRRPKIVAAAACAFARGLASQGVAYTLKHFPGLGAAKASTDTQPVTIFESRRKLAADAAPYRKCGHGALAAVMVSSASYRHLTRRTPAVLARKIYRRILPGYNVTALTIGDSFETGAITGLRTPARRAINAGLDMVMYPNTESTGLYSYSQLLADARRGTLHRSRVRAAAARVLQLKRTLGLD